MNIYNILKKIEACLSEWKTDFSITQYANSHCFICCKHIKCDRNITRNNNYIGMKLQKIMEQYNLQDIT